MNKKEASASFFLHKKKVVKNDNQENILLMDYIICLMLNATLDFNSLRLTM